MKMNMGNFVANNLAVNVDVGFIPDLVLAYEGLEEGTWQSYVWIRDRVNAASLVGQFGMKDVAGTKSVVSAAASGFAAYDASVAKQMIPSPDGDGYAAATLPAAWTQTLGSAATARSTTAAGTIIKPTSGNETGLVYECTTDGTSAATEPTWPTKVGESVTDSSTVWIARESIIKQVGAKGFTLGATGQTDTDEWSWIAFQADKISPDVDSVVQDPV